MECFGLLSCNPIHCCVQQIGGEASLELTGSLDKEGVQGPSNLIVGVICDRLGTNDTGFTIPINIRYI